jgi:hypothetical protein
MRRHIIGGIVVAIIALIGGAYMLPQMVHVERTTLIQRPAASIFPYINSLRRANEWSPWSEYDPNVKITYSGPDEGKGAQMSWAGNKKVGSGTQVITETFFNRKVSSDLQFGDQGPAKASLTLTTTEHGTKVVWTLDVDVGNNPIGRYMGMNLDKMVGPDYERGLAKLKALVEAAPPAAAQPAPQPASAPSTAPKAATS